MVFTTQQMFSKHFNIRLVYSVTSIGVLLLLTTSVTWVLLQLAGVSAGTVSSKKLVIIDTDPGVDDAVALFTTLGDLDVKVLAITCVRGNTNVPNVVVNALKVLLIAKNNEVPVYTGHNYGLIDSPSDGDYFGTDGFENLPFPHPPSPTNAQEEHAASFLARIVKEYPGEITVFAIGPLTNIALALQLNPDFLVQVKRLVILGGSIRGQGNSVPGVEFNMYMDPAAASIVLERASLTNTTITVVPMETCKESGLTLDWRWNTLSKINNSVVSFLNKLEWKNQQSHKQTDYYPYDTYAAAVTLCPEFVVHSQEYYGFVECEARRLQGAFTLDYANYTRRAANVEVILEVNTTVIKNKLIQNLSNFS